MTSGKIIRIGILLMIMACLPVLFFGQTQQATVTGVVNNDKGGPLDAATVHIMSGQKRIATTSTDSVGRFKVINVSPGAYSFTVSRVGYEQQTLTGYSLKGGQTTSILITMVPLANAMGEVVVVGYGTQKKATLTGSVASVKMDNVLKDRPVTSTAEALQGAVPGLQITQGSGQPGSSTEINIRGYTTINGSTTPLVVVDNVPMDIDDVNPADIENVTVLKDASASAIYGGRAAFGVIVITTKKGAKNQKPRFDYSNNFAFTTASTLPVKSTPLQYVSALNDFGTTTAWSGQDIKTWLGLLQDYQTNPSKYPDGITTVNNIKYPLAQQDLYGRLFEHGFEQIHNFSFSGGSEKTTYRTSVAYTNQDGILTGKNDTYKRYNFNSNLTTALTNSLTASVNVFYNNETQTTPVNYPGIFYNAITFGSHVPVGSGQLPGTNDTLPCSTPDNLAKIEVPLNIQTNNLRLFGKLDYSPVKNLKITGEYTFTQTNYSSVDVRNTNRYVNPNTYQLDIVNPTSSYKKYTSATNVNALNLYASYMFNIANAHNFTFLAGTNQELSKEAGYSSTRLNLLSPSVPSLSTSTGTPTVDDDFNEYGLSGYFFRFNYSYKNKYLLEATGRYDGSSRFPTNERYGIFPGASAGWVLTEEKFLQPLKNIFSQIKLRGSYGEIGNQVTYLTGTTVQDYYPAVPSMNIVNAGWIDPSTNIVYTTLGSPRLVSQSFTWERIRTFDLGIDATLLKNKLSATFDVYREETIGMLVNGSSLPASLGTQPPKENRGNLKVEGWDMNLTWKDNIGKDFNYSVGVNLAGRNPAVITKYNNPAKLLSDYYEGMKINEIWGYKTYGYFTADDFAKGVLDAKLINNKTVADNKGLMPGIAGFQGVYQNPGDIRFVDANGDGVISPGANTVANPGDRAVIGNSTRRFQYGFNGSASYKNFDLSFFIQGVGDRDVWISNQVFWPYVDQFSSIYAHQLDYWTPENQNAYYPRMYANASSNTGTSRSTQTKYLSNGAYLRVKSIAAGYTLPQKWASRMHLSRARIFFSGENLFTFDHLPAGLDPEASDLGNGGIYPFLKKMSFGVNVSF